MRKLLAIIIILSVCLVGAKFGNLRIEKIPHAFGGYADKAYTLTCASDTWTHVTNGTSDLWSGNEIDGMRFVADQMILTESGDYSGVVTLTVSASTGKDFHLRIFNVTQNRVEGFPLGISTTGAGNEMQCTIPVYIEGTAGDVLQMQVNSADGTDPVLDDAIFYVGYLHS